MARKMILCDTCILIDFLRGREPVRDALHGIGAGSVGMSVVTYMELCKGVRNKSELGYVLQVMKSYRLIDINSQVSSKAITLIQQYHLSHNMGIPDALIAGTALVLQVPLWTLNVKDFVFIPGLSLYMPDALA